MPTKLKVRLPQLKLRGKIIMAAAAVFIIAIAASLYFVVSTSREADLKDADQEMAALAQQRADTIRVTINQYSLVASATARAAEAIIADPTASLSVFGPLVTKQAESVPDALGVIIMIEPQAGITSRPDFFTSGFGYKDNYFAAYAQRTGSGLTLASMEAKPGEGYPWIEDDTKNGDDVVGPIDYSGLLYTSVVSIIHDAQGKQIGLAIVAFDSAGLTKILGTDAPMGTGFAAVVNADNVWVMNPDPKVLGKPVDVAAISDTVTALGSSDLYQSTGPGPDGVAYAITAKSIPLYGSKRHWTSVIAVPQSTLLIDSDNQMRSFLIGGVVILVLGLIAFFFVGSSIARPILRMTATMRRIAENDYDVEVPYANSGDEIGDMAQAVEVFRENGRRVSQMTEAEAARVISDQRQRSEMMSQLREAFVGVVDAAVAGDFSKRVDTEFSDQELNVISASINNLVTTVDRGLGETGEVLSALANTDLTHRVEGDYQGAFARLKNDTNAVAEKLAEIVGQLKTTSGSLKLATGEILSGANDLSERTTKQASTIQETSAAMDRLAETVVQNAKRANDASDVSSSVTKTAEEGGVVMNKATEAMERITASSAKISNIIGLIDDIAFQTNLLALNASVEAARAGEAGKGFAVVAVEVRRLAQSAAQASAEIKGLIEQSGNEVAGGSKLVADAASKLTAMLQAARSSNELMSGIARDSREQASAIEEVTTAVRQMDEMTQHNAALVEEINASIEQTESQASELDRVVDIFTLSDEGNRPVSRLPAAAAAPAPAAKKGGIKAMQERVKQAAKSYLTRGATATVVKEDEWSEF